MFAMTSSRTSKVVALSLSQGLTTIVALASGMILTRVLSWTDLATYRQTMLAYDVAIPLLSLGIDSGIYYFLPTEKSRMRGVLSDGLLLMVGMGLLYAIFIALGGNHLLAKRFSNPAIVNTLAYLIPLPIIMLPAKLLSPVMVVQGQVRKLSIYNVVTSVALAICIIAACLVWKTPDALILVRVVVSMAIGAAGVALMLQALPHDLWRPCWSNMKSMVAYSIPLVLAGAIGTIALQLDKIVVSSMCSPETFAIYSTGAMEIPLIGIVTGSISNVMLVDFRKAFAANELSEALRLYRMVPAKTTLFLFPVMVYFMLAAKPAMIVLFSGKYAASATAFMLYLLVIPSRTLFLGGMAAVGKNKIILRNSAIGLLLNLVFSIAFVRIFGYVGAILATIAVLGLWNVPTVFYEISRSLHTSISAVYPWKTAGLHLLMALAAAVPTAIVLGLLGGAPPVVQLAVSGAVFTAIYVLIGTLSGRIDVKRSLMYFRVA